MPRSGKSIQHNRLFRTLLEKAQLQGHLAVEELQGVIPDGGADQLRELIDALSLQGVEILDDRTIDKAKGVASTGESQSGVDSIASDDAVSLYLREMSLTPLLTVEEEIDLAKRIERADQAKSELSNANGRNVDQLSELEAQIWDGQVARDCLIRANTRLVVSIARRYVGRGVPFLDLIQEGNLGLMKAVEKYEYQRGFRFSTYATWWIRQSIIRAVADQGRTIRVPVHMADRLRQVYKVAREMEQKLGRSPTPKELADRLDLDDGKLRWMLQVAQPLVSLESPVGEDDSEFGMYVEDSSSPSPAQITYENMLRERVDEVLATLSPREARILRLRFGLGQDRAYTLEEVGKKFGLTRERIRQIEGKALRRLRQPCRARLLREYS